MTGSLPDPAAWGVTCTLEPIPGGHRNRVYQEADSAPRYVFKSTRRSEDALAWLQPVQASARQAGFIVPGLLRSTQGTYSCDGWTTEPFVAGRPATLNDLTGLIPQLTLFHQLARGHSQRPGFASARELTQLVGGGDVDLSRMPASLVTLLRAIWQDLPPDETPIHGDLAPQNVIMTTDGPCLIDWDESRCDSSVFDLDSAQGRQSRERLAWEVACSWHVEPRYARQKARQLGFGL